jgi:type II secretory pathway pseudopilin PulG
MLKNNKGMTLIELMTALVLLMIVVTGFSVFFTRTILWTIKTSNDTANYVTAKKFSDNSMAGMITNILDPDELTELHENLEDNFGTKIVNGGLINVSIAYQNGTTDTDNRNILYVTVEADTPSETAAREIRYHVFTK